MTNIFENKYTLEWKHEVFLPKDVPAFYHLQSCPYYVVSGSKSNENIAHLRTHYKNIYILISILSSDITLFTPLNAIEIHLND